MKARAGSERQMRELWGRRKGLSGVLGWSHMSVVDARWMRSRHPGEVFVLCLTSLNQRRWQVLLLD
jgi:hypothetical protein